MKKDVSIKPKNGKTICKLEDLLFPVEFIDNPNRANRENSKVVQGMLNEVVPISDEEMSQLPQDEIDAILDGAPRPTKTIVSPIDLNYCSPIYALVPNADIFPRVEEIFNNADEGKGIKFSVEYSHTDHVRFYANYTIEDKRFAYKMKGTNDVIKFAFNFQHSYNGVTKYKGIAGFFRLVCTNGLTIPVKEMEKYNLVLEGKHTAAILHSLQEFEAILNSVVKDFAEVKKSITAKYELLGGHMVEKVEDRITEVLKATGIAAIENSKFNTLAEITKQIDFESNKKGLGYNGKVNDWLIYNSINRYINNDTLNIKAPEVRRESDSKVLEYMLKTAV